MMSLDSFGLRPQLLGMLHLDRIRKTSSLRTGGASAALSEAAGGRVEALPRLDSNQDAEIQSLVCYRYTIRQ